MIQIVEQTDEEKMVMYMKFNKKKLIEMLIQCNKIIDSIPLRIEFMEETHLDSYYEKKPTERLLGVVDLQ